MSNTIPVATRASDARICLALQSWLAAHDHDRAALAYALEQDESVVRAALATSDCSGLLPDELSALRLLAFLRNMEMDAGHTDPIAREAGDAVLTRPGPTPT